MIEDIYREAKGEIIESMDVIKAISKITSVMFKDRIQQKDNGSKISKVGQ